MCFFLIIETVLLQLNMKVKFVNYRTPRKHFSWTSLWKWTSPDFFQTSPKKIILQNLLISRFYYI